MLRKRNINTIISQKETVMLFNSMHFLLFFPIVVFLYFVIPNRIKQLWLLVTSYYFYMSWDAKYGLLILFCTVCTYLCGLLIEKNRGGKKEKRKTYVYTALCISILLAILAYFKYTGFALDTLVRILSMAGIVWESPEVNIVLPVGISFFTFQSISYVLDVYRGDIYAERNFFRYALFVSFFPQLVAGPIERSRNLLKQLAVPQKFCFEYAREGILLMIWGYFLKMVIADRAAIFVNAIYADTYAYQGWYAIVATALFAIQIYCDFSGYSIIAMGAAKVLGIHLMENFDAPYLSESVSEFWRRWHISLTSWFKDYLYIPLGGSRKGLLRKHINRVIVFLVSGLWHGAQWSFVIWGGLNGLYQVMGDILKPARDKVVQLLHLNRNSIGHKLYRITVTNILICIALVFFRSNSITEAFRFIFGMLTIHNPWVLVDGSLYCHGLDQKNFMLLLISIGILFFADFCKKRGIVVRNVILQQDHWVRWLVFSLSISAILLFGIWGTAYDATNFIYFQF